MKRVLPIALLCLAAGLVVAGVALISTPAAFIVAGLELAVFALNQETG